MIRDRYTVVVRDRGVTLASAPKSGFFQSREEAISAAFSMISDRGRWHSIDVRYYEVSAEDVVIWLVHRIWVDADGEIDEDGGDTGEERRLQIIGKFQYTGDPVRARIVA